MYLHWKRTVNLNTVTAAVGGKSDHCDASFINEFFSIRRLKQRINIEDSSSQDSTGLAIETSSHNPFFHGIGFFVLMPCPTMALSAYVMTVSDSSIHLCSLLAALNTSTV
ncbi:hypothetical protein TNCV_4896251 [Trichonephila clavipes]|uniref:Uncharacterized protein n=1 Tax=Trichonephila clavipes TaxID=2585209 RepID=A0A8X7BAK0_TRICX|nr:hypothetical protein TNCV_4896251 [Trichonephila clavipes]